MGVMAGSVMRVRCDICFWWVSLLGCKGWGGIILSWLCALSPADMAHWQYNPRCQRGRAL